MMHIFKYLNRRFKNLSLLKKYTVYVAVPLFAITVSGLIIYTDLEKRKIIADVKNRRTNQLIQIRNNIELYVNDIENICDWIASSRTTNKLFRLSGELGSRMIFHYQDTFDYLNDMRLTQQVAGIRIFLYSPLLPEKWDYIYNMTNLTQRERDFLLSHKYDRRFWYESYEDTVEPLRADRGLPDGESSFLACLKPILEIEKLLGFALVDVEPDALFESVKSSADHTSSIYVVNAEGYVVYPPLEDEERNFSEYMGMYELQQEVADKNDMHIYTHLPDLSCYLVIVEDLTQPYLTITKTQALFLLLFFLLLLALIIMMRFMINMSLKRMKKMIDQLADFESDTNKKVESDIYDDEIGMLNKRFINLVVRIKRLIASIKSEEELKREAEFKAMQYQINPHFLYNILDLFQMRAEIRSDYVSSEGLTKLASMLRYNTFYSPFAKMANELEHIRQYVYLQNVRYNDKIRLAVHCDEPLHAVKCIKFILQPIIENSITHGWKDRRKKLDIVIKIKSENDHVSIEVADTGIGMPDNDLSILRENIESHIFDDSIDREAQKHVGLQNVIKRLQCQYGNDFDYRIESALNEGFNIAFSFPAF